MLELPTNLHILMLLKLTHSSLNQKGRVVRLTRLIRAPEVTIMAEVVLHREEEVDQEVQILAERLAAA